MKELIAFIFVELVSLFPLGLYFVSKKVIGQDAEMAFYFERVKAYAIRGMITLIILIPFFVLYTDKRRIIIFLGIVFQIINRLIFKKKK